MNDKKPKEPWAFPDCPPEIDRIIDKLDSGQKLLPAESKALSDWEDAQGGFGGFMTQVQAPEKKAQ